MEASTYLERGRIEFRSKDPQAVREFLGRFLSDRGGFWPLVKHIVLRGPFSVLPPGFRLVDLPGLDDPNGAREQRARKALGTCPYVWIVTGLDRIIRHQTQEFLLDESFQHRLIQSGRLGSLSFVLTKADDLDPEEAAEELGLPPGPEWLARQNLRQAAVTRLRDYLGRLGESMARKQALDSLQSAALIRAFQACPIFAVSARMSLQARDLPSGVRRSNQESRSGLPDLKEFLRNTLREQRASAQRCLVEDRVLEFLQARQNVALTLKLQGEDARREETERLSRRKAWMDALFQTWDEGRRSVLENLGAGMDQMESRLWELLSQAVQDTRDELERIVDGWTHLHHLSLQAACRHGGQSGVHDLPGEVIQLVLRRMSYRWSQLFEKDLMDLLKQTQDRFGALASQWRSALKNQAVEDFRELRRGLDGALKQTEFAVSALSGEVRLAFQEQQVRLFDHLPKKVREPLLPAFARAAEEKGSGMKERMMGHLREAARELASRTLEEAAQEVLQGFREHKQRCLESFLKESTLPAHLVQRLSGCKEKAALPDDRALEAHLERLDQAIEDIQKMRPQN